MISQYKKGQPQNPNSINHMVNDDVLDSSLDNLKTYTQGCISYKFDEIGDEEISTINDLNIKNVNPFEPIKIKYQKNNPYNINDLESDCSTDQGIYDEQQEKLQNLENEDFWKIKNTNQHKYRVFQKKSKKKTEYFD